MHLPDKVKIVEVAARDGLQNESKTLSIEARIEFINRLGDAGLKVIEAGSFVSAKWIPQMAQSAEVLSGINKLTGVTYPVLVPNLQGLNDAIKAGATDIAVFAAASESFSQKNINCTIDESINRYSEIAEIALSKGMKIRAYVSCVLGCPYEGEISTDAVVRVSKKLFKLGCHEISLGDTIGVGTPVKAQELFSEVSTVVPLNKLAAHFHDTYGQALANILAVLQIGVSVIDSSVSGLGGCPYAQGASGNVATEDVIYMLDGLGIQTGVDLEKLREVGRFISKHLNRLPLSSVGRISAA